MEMPEFVSTKNLMLALLTALFTTFENWRTCLASGSFGLLANVASQKMRDVLDNALLKRLDRNTTDLVVGVSTVPAYKLSRPSKEEARC